MRPMPLFPVMDRFVLIGFVLVYLTRQCPASVDDSAEALFENRIRPVLIESCFRCHGDTKESGGLRVDSREALLIGGESGSAMVLGKPDESLVVKAIKRHSDVSAMPPDKDKALRPDQIAAFEKWILVNAPWPKLSKNFEKTTHWAFKPIKANEPPTVDSGRVENPVDAFVLSKQKSTGMRSLAMKATKQALIRRATFDLTGLPPTPAEVEAFEEDTTPTAYATLIDRLLESPDYGRRWGRHWLDVVRYADTAGETADYPVSQAWRYRDYVIDAFNADKPYDQFLREQIAGDILAVQGPSERYAEQVTATGYLAISRRFGFDSENYHHLTIQDTIDTLGQSVLGLSLGCARCHDHKFDDISMVDYYGLYAIFDSSRYSFPGSEQKQRVRSMVPLVPPNESLKKWREFDQQVASISSKLIKAKLPVPNAILRSLNDMDGDFEMQAPANGGSNGVLVPPWLYEGKISVTNAAQSPFKNLYASGKVGASIAADAGKYRISQSIYPSRSKKDSADLYINLDFRISAADAKTSGSHRFWFGSISNSRALSFEISADAISMMGDEHSERIGEVKPNQWHNLQLKLDLAGGTVTGTLSSSGPHATATIVSSFAGKPLLASWTGQIDLVSLESVDNGTKAGPVIEYDNLGVQQEPIPPPQSLAFAAEGSTESDSIDALNRELQTLGGMSGDFELQSEGQSPASPFNAGPNSVVKVSERSQSPFQNFVPRGTFGIYMPNRGNYDGFGLVLPKTWNADKMEPLFACFDFRCVDIAAGDDGTWRYYIGHGPGNSAAVELFFRGKQFYRRSADAKEPVCSLVPGEWYQVQLSIDMKSRTYSGTLQSQTKREEFRGELASGWDGAIDYSFIDSYGHIGGVRPSLDVDNYAMRETPFPAFDAQPAKADVASNDARRERASRIRQKLAAIEESAKESTYQLNAMLTDGPFAMAYGMAEGTPHGVPIQLRGEPSQPGDLVARGFVKALGNESLPADTSGSGRLELANWLIRPDNPLTARVMMNRIWQYHFGQGLVKTPNDFGVRGIPPTHPELLDYLASQFMKNGWSMKAMHRLIMLSQLYQQASPFSDKHPNEAAPSPSPPNDSALSFPRRRLSAEEIRDSILLVSGELDRESAQGHPFPSPLSFGFSQHGPFTAVYDHNKRSIYLMTQRLKRHPFLALFDGPDPNASTPSRLETTVPTQALYFLNDPFVYAKSEAWAKRLIASNADEERQIELAFRGAFSRMPSSTEQSDAIDFLQAYREELLAAGQDNRDIRALAGLVRTLFGSNEFLHVD